MYLLPHYIREGKSYLTISFGCTGGQHRSVMIAEDVSKHLRKAGYRVKVVHRDSPEMTGRSRRSQSSAQSRWCADVSEDSRLKFL